MQTTLNLQAFRIPTKLVDDVHKQSGSTKVRGKGQGMADMSTAGAQQPMQKAVQSNRKAKYGVSSGSKKL